MNSMTGFGRAAADIDRKGRARSRWLVEIRSVNHRYGEVSVRLPRAFLAQENDIKRLVSTILKRGKIDVTVQWEEAVGGDSVVQVNQELAAGY